RTARITCGWFYRVGPKLDLCARPTLTGLGRSPTTRGELNVGKKQKTGKQTFGSTEEGKAPPIHHCRRATAGSGSEEKGEFDCLSGVRRNYSEKFPMAMVSAAAANENGKESKGGLKEKTLQIFEDFLTRVAKLEELGAVANRYLSGFQQSLDFLRRPPIDMESKLMSKLISANDTKRMKSYIQAGCCNTLDRVQNTSK
ncbi:unnamed protein product, partial [Linum tenue]